MSTVQRELDFLLLENGDYLKNDQHTCIALWRLLEQFSTKCKIEKWNEIAHTHKDKHLYTLTKEGAGIMETYMLWFLQKSPGVLVVIVY